MRWWGLVFSCMLSLNSYADLSGFTIGIDPGHGGGDSGAQANDVRESDVNLQTALAMKAFLELDGAQVVMSRTTDKSFTSAVSGRSELVARTRFFNSRSVDYTVSVHHNAAGSQANGVLAYVARGFCNAQSGQLAHQTNQQVQLGNGLQFMSGARSSAVLCPNKPGVFQYNAIMVKETAMPAVLAEISFLTNVKEAARLKTPEYLQRNGWSLYAALVAHIGGGRQPIPFKLLPELMPSPQEDIATSDLALLAPEANAVVDAPESLVFSWENPTHVTIQTVWFNLQAVSIAENSALVVGDTVGRCDQLEIGVQNSFTVVDCEGTLQAKQTYRWTVTLATDTGQQYQQSRFFSVALPAEPAPEEPEQPVTQPEIPAEQPDDSSVEPAQPTTEPETPTPDDSDVETTPEQPAETPSDTNETDVDAPTEPNDTPDSAELPTGSDQSTEIPSDSSSSETDVDAPSESDEVPDSAELPTEPDQPIETPSDSTEADVPDEPNDMSDETETPGTSEGTPDTSNEWDTPAVIETPKPEPLSPSPTVPPASVDTSFCNFVKTVPYEQCVTLVRLYVYTHGDDWKNALKNNWLQKDNPCVWVGVQCESGEVIKLNLTNTGLSGVLPDLSQLRSLTHLQLANNQLVGTLPPANKLPSGLQVLELYDNQFGGALPDWDALIGLNFLRLHNNKLCSAVPASILKLEHLFWLELDHNYLTVEVDAVRALLWLDNPSFFSTQKKSAVCPVGSK